MIPTVISLPPQQGKTSLTLFPPQSVLKFYLTHSGPQATTDLHPLPGRTPAIAKVPIPTIAKALIVTETKVRAGLTGQHRLHLPIDLPSLRLGGLNLLPIPLLACEQGGGERVEGRGKRGLGEGEMGKKNRGEEKKGKVTTIIEVFIRGRGRRRR